VIGAALFIPIATESTTIWGIATAITFAAGAWLYLSSKVPMWKQGHRWVFGAAKLAPNLVWRYWAGYVVMAVALVMALALAVAIELR